MNPVVVAASEMISATDRKNVFVTIANGMIREISEDGSFSSEKKPARLICPCLIDAHTHLFLSGTTNQTYRQMQQALEEKDVIQQIEAHIRQSMQYGVFAVRDMGDAKDHLQYVKIPAPFFVMNTGPGYCVEGRYGRFVATPVSHMKELPAAIAQKKTPYHWVKIIQSGMNSLTDFTAQCACQFTEPILKEAVEIAHKKGFRVAAHANGEEAVSIAIDAGCDSIEHGYKMGNENLKRMAEAQIYWTPTAVAMKNLVRYGQGTPVEKENAQRYLDDQMEAIFRARQYGVPILAGSDAGSFGVDHGKGLWEELQIFVEAGMSVKEAIFCASVKSAKFLAGWDDYGIIDVGKPANFVVLETLMDRFQTDTLYPKEVWVEGKPLT